MAKKGVTQRRLHAKARRPTLEDIARRRPTLVDQARKIGHARRELEKAEKGINLTHLIAELSTNGMSANEIARALHMSLRQVRRYLAEWKRSTMDGVEGTL